MVGLESVRVWVLMAVSFAGRELLEEKYLILSVVSWRIASVVLTRIVPGIVFVHRHVILPATQVVLAYGAESDRKLNIPGEVSRQQPWLG